MRRWRILEWEKRPERTQEIEYDCLRCGREAMLTINRTARVTAICAGGIILADTDYSEGDAPEVIECPHCRKRFTNDPDHPLAEED